MLNTPNNLYSLIKQFLSNRLLKDTLTLKFKLGICTEVVYVEVQHVKVCQACRRTYYRHLAEHF